MSALTVVAIVVLGLVVAAIGGVIWLGGRITRHEATLRAEGRPALAVLVLCNRELFESQDPYLVVPAVVVLSFDRPTPELLAALRDVASRAEELYRASQAEVRERSATEREVAEIVANDVFVESRRRALPREFVGGREVYLADLYLFRNRLAPGVDSPKGSALPCLVTGRAEGLIMQLGHDEPIARRVVEAVGA